MEILFNDGSGDGGANAAAASVADGQDVDGVLHGSGEIAEGSEAAQAACRSSLLHRTMVATIW